ncbi:MAG: diacylglycerol kinase family protein [Candidatus Saccharimonadales bacterium]
MYYYIVNPSSGDRSFESIQAKLQAKVRQLDIDGEFAKTLDADDAARITQAALRQGAQTIVVVGGDRTVNEVITAVNESSKSSISVGVIPIGHTNTLAQQIGIRDWNHAVELLAARRLRSFRLIHINDHSFIHSCVLESTNDSTAEALIEVDGAYRIRGPILQAQISNTRLHNPSLSNELFVQLATQNSETGRLQRWLKRETPRPALLSQLHARVIVLEFPHPYRAVVDGREIIDTQFRIRLSEKPIHIITAKYDSNGSPQN